jgi:hypothetical protein
VKFKLIDLGIIPRFYEREGFCDCKGSVSGIEDFMLEHITWDKVTLVELCHRAIWPH